MKDRIKKIRKSFPEEGRTQETFAKFLGIPKQNLSSYEIGRRTPSDAVIQLICEKCDVNKEYLLNGTLPMKKEIDVDFGEICREIGKNDPKFKEAITKYYELSPEDKQLFWKFMERFSKPEKEG